MSISCHCLCIHIVVFTASWEPWQSVGPAIQPAAATGRGRLHFSPSRSGDIWRRNGWFNDLSRNQSEDDSPLPFSRFAPRGLFVQRWWWKVSVLLKQILIIFERFCLRSKEHMTWIVFEITFFKTYLPYVSYFKIKLLIRFEFRLPTYALDGLTFYQEGNSCTSSFLKLLCICQICIYLYILY